jgi:Domain of unknown function (DUF5916)/Carbohydrate family 9 binding domain-like
MRYYLLFIVLLATHILFAQTKQFGATKITSTIKVDGKIDDAAWASVNSINDFITSYPDFGKEPSKKTEVKIVYDNTAMYVLALMYDDKVNIRKQLTQRDAIERQDCDVFTIGLDTYQDKQNGFIFQVSAAGVQSDARQSSANGTDRSWDAVWESAVSIIADKWIVEIKIPFSAIRFAKKDIQTWGLQLTRNVRSKNESNTWSPQDPNKAGSINQWGALSNLKDIVPPLRLSFLPYISGGVRNSPTNNGRTTEYLKSGGMDVKYGINESFTVDMTLIPDFAQVQSDNTFLNLTPFQVKFDDFRPFFTEGTELFNKAGLFYSRRIGAEPSGTSNVLDFARKNTSYTINKNPGITRLYNATKLSGRTKNNIGIGFFNAITAPMNATLTNNITKADTTILTEPLTNYNVFVFDKALKNRSSYTITNTNVLRKGNSRNANVTGFDISLFDKKNDYNFSGSIRYSNIWGTQEKKDGYKTELSAGKISGKWQYSTGVNIESDTYDPNDLGILFNNNSVEHFAEVSLNYNTPTKKYLTHRYKISSRNEYLYKPFNWTTFELEANAFFLFKNFWDANFVLNTQPLDFNDFFESRTPGLKLNRFPYLFIGIGGSSDSRKKLFGGWFIGGAESRVKDDPFLKIDLNSRYRFSDRFQITATFNRESDKGQWGFSHRDTISTLVKDYNDPFIAFRKVKTNNIILGAQYNFTPRMNWTIRMRHNWTSIINRSFHKLKADGSWDDIAFVNGRNRNFNAFNIDMFYTWDFKWGSRLTLGWKNALGGNVFLDPYKNTSYTKNLGGIFNNPHSNEVTLKIVYYLDYLSLRKKA